MKNDAYSGLRQRLRTRIWPQAIVKLLRGISRAYLRCDFHYVKNSTFHYLVDFATEFLIKFWQHFSVGGVAIINVD